MLSKYQVDRQDLINQSWKRCQEFGLSPTDPIDDSLLTGKNLQQVLKENEYIIQQAIPVLKKLYPVIQSNGLVTVIVDRNGIVIHRVGNLDIENQLDYLSVGSNWSEGNKGTNAMGIALYDQETISIHAEHHFNVKNHFLTCAASPIYSPAGELIGAINISARKELYNPFILSLTRIISETLQNQLLLEYTKHEKILTIKELELTSNFSSLPLLSLDHDKNIIRANQAARLLLGDDCIGKAFHHPQGYAVELVSDQSRKVYRSVVSLSKTDNKKKTTNRLYTISDILGSCLKIEKVKQITKKAALSDYPVMIYGESGTGKELVAQSLHSAGPRHTKPFIALNCSAIPETLIESELFGYEEGAFTGANRGGVAGKFEAANGGTIFLDEIGDMSMKAQAALLRILQESTVTRIGGVKTIPVNTRVVCATNKNLREEVQSGRFREDLYYRLKGIFITMPPLRERADLIELAEHLMKNLDNPFTYLSDQAKEKLAAYPWPGNIRELNSILMQASFFAKGNQIKVEELYFEDAYKRDNEKTISPSASLSSLGDAEQEAIRKTLHSVEWNISKAASVLEISRNTLYLKIKKYNLHR